MLRFRKLIHRDILVKNFAKHIFYNYLIVTIASTVLHLYIII